MIRNFKPNKTPVGIANINRIRTDNINRKVWEYLKRYQSQTFVRSKIKNKRC